MYETLLRPHEVYTYPPLQDIYSIGEKLKKAEAKREEQRLKQIAGNRASASASGLTFYSSSSSSSGPTTNRRTAAQKRKREEEDVNEGEEEEVVDKMVVVVDEQDLHPEEGGEVEPKRVRLDDEEDVVLDDFVPTLVATPTMTSTNASVRMGVSKASSEVRGHTSYLTFACLIPFSPPVKEGVQEEGDAGMSIQVKEEVTIEADI
jgi:tRNA (adenine57-N1/adenine58-N1)-methyltransferase